jgi:hypothetical protein
LQQTACLLRERGEGGENQQKEKKEKTRKKIRKEKKERNKCPINKNGSSMSSRMDTSPWILMKRERKKEKEEKKEKEKEKHRRTPFPNFCTEQAQQR